MFNRSKKAVSRRKLIKLAGAGAIATGLGVKLSNSATATAPQAIDRPNADQALKFLTEGNQRYVKHKQTHPDESALRLQQVAKAQTPFATVLSCSDSRVPPELLFDQGLGDLFVIRVAGNIVDDAVLGSIEFSAAELNVPLVMVLGHERCGAVSAAVKHTQVPGHISTLTNAIMPAVERVKNKAGDPIDNAVRANVQMCVEKLQSSSTLIAERVKQGKLKIVGARYDLDTGNVEMLT